MDERPGRIERVRCRAAVLWMTGLTVAASSLGGCSYHGHYGHGYGHYSYGHCASGDDALFLLLFYGAAGILHWCFN